MSLPQWLSDFGKMIIGESEAVSGSVTVPPGSNFKPLSPEDIAERDRKNAEFYDRLFREQREAEEREQRRAALRAAINSSLPPGRTSHPWAGEEYDYSRTVVTNGRYGPLTATSMQNVVNVGPGQYYNPYQQAVFSATGQHIFTTSGFGGVSSVATPPAIPKPSPAFMEVYFDELERAREARVVEKT